SRAGKLGRRIGGSGIPQNDHELGTRQRRADGQEVLGLLIRHPQAGNSIRAGFSSFCISVEQYRTQADYFFNKEGGRVSARAEERCHGNFVSDVSTAADRRYRKAAGRGERRKNSLRDVPKNFGRATCVTKGLRAGNLRSSG